MKTNASPNSFMRHAGRVLSRQGAFMLVGALACFLMLPLYAGWLHATADAARLLIGLGVCGGFLMYAGEIVTARDRRRTVETENAARDGRYLPKRLIKS